MLYSKTAAIAAVVAISLSTCVSATTVRVSTSVGNFDVNLYDIYTPITVANFLSYVSTQAYDGTFIHRSEPGFVIQGGGFKFDATSASPFVAIPQRAAIQNEPKLANVRATIAMAKVQSNPNSATNQWFINLNNNSANLDVQNGGFTVFGEIDAVGMEVVQTIAGLPTNTHPSFSGIPLRNYTSSDYQAGRSVTSANLVVVESIKVINTEADTLNGKVPSPTTYTPSTGGSGGSDSSGGGSSSLWSLLALSALFGGRRLMARR